jgi:hypothetical protein
MKATPTTKEQVKLLRKLLDTNFENIESILPEIHQKKNNLNYLKMVLNEIESAVNKGKYEALNEKLKNLNNLLTASIQDFNVIYQKLNQNPARLHGYKTTLKKICNDCSKNYSTEVEFDTTPTSDDSLLTANTGIFLLFTTAIETICLQGYKNVYVLFVINNGIIELKITGHDKKLTTAFNKELVSSNFEFLMGLLAWKLPTVMPETNWQSLIWFKI